MDTLTISTWEQWKDVHSSSEQKKRQERALEKKCSPISINKEEASGLFKGSKGQYVTSLSQCDCVDFARRKLPCKHMYRLAHELDVFPLSKDLQSEHLSKEAAMELIQSCLSEDEQIKFKYFCYLCGNNNSGETLYPKSFADKLISCNLASEVTQPERLLKHLHIQSVRQFLPEGVKNPRTKAALIELVAPFVTKEDIVFPDNQKCVTLHPSISNLGHTLHRKLCALYPDERQESSYYNF